MALVASGSLHLRRGRAGEAPVLHALMTRAGRHLLATLGFDNWTPPPYPLERVAEDLAAADPAREVWVAEQGGVPVAMFTLATQPQYAYDEGVRWRAGEGEVLWLNRLSVDPDAQGAGVGAWCMREAERLTREAGRRAIHLDALRDNAPLAAFYQRLGYEPRGVRQSGARVFTCYEKLLDE